MNFDKFKKEYIPLVKNFDCGNVVINNFLNSENALDFNQGITYVLLSDDKDFIIGYFNISVGRIDQIQKVMEHVTAENYKDMSQRVRKLDSDDSVTGSSNFGKFIKLFESDDSGWIEEINGYL